MEKSGIVIGTAVVIVLSIVVVKHLQKKKSPLEIIYDRIGGEAAVDALVDVFYEDFVL